MSTASLLDRAETRTDTATTTTAAQRLRTTMAAVRVSFTWFGVQKTLDPRAEGARPPRRSTPRASSSRAAKKLLDTKHPAFRAVTAVRGKIASFWKSQSLPFPEPGVRLIKQSEVEAFARQMADYQVELDDAVAKLDRHYRRAEAGGRRAARLAVQRRGLSRDARRPVRRRVRLPHRRAARLPGRALARSSTSRSRRGSRPGSRRRSGSPRRRSWRSSRRLVAHLTERISGTNDDGTPKVFRDSAIGNLVEFFDRFRQLNVRSNDQLDALVAEAQRVVRGVGPQDLRDSDALRAAWSRPAVAGPVVARRPAGRPAPAADPAAGAGAGGGVMQLVVDPDGPAPRGLLRGDRPGRLRPPDDHPRQPRRARPRRPLARRPVSRRRAGARPVRPPQRGPGGRARLARSALARRPGLTTLGRPDIAFPSSTASSPSSLPPRSRQARAAVRRAHAPGRAAARAVHQRKRS